MSPAPESTSPAQPRWPAWRAGLLAAGLLAIATFCAHGCCLWDGPSLDDHWHQYRLRADGWSPADLVRSLVFEPAQWVHLWWQDKSVRWEYLRPVFTLAMKVLYRLVGHDQPWPLHAFAVALHWLSACMVYALARRCAISRRCAFFGALFFVLYPHAAMTVAWSSSLNAVMVTTLMLAALLAYWRASGIPLGVRAAHDAAAARIRGGWFAAVLLLWMLALFTRENAVLLPAFFVALEVATGGFTRLRRRAGVTILLAIIGGAFVVMRVALIRHPMPDVYARMPASPYVDYALWAFAKLLHYLTTSIWFAPMAIGPTGRYQPFVEAPFDCVLMIAIVLLIGGGYWLCTRRLNGAWLWPLWVFLAILPVIPVVATPHSGYLGGVGVALGVAYVARAAADAAARWQAVLLRGVVAFYLLAAAAFTQFDRWQWEAVMAAERVVLDGVSACPPGPQVRDVFFLNLPFVDIYAKPALDRRLGSEFEGVACHVLTFAPDAFICDSHSRVEPRDDYSFTIDVDGRPYFSGLLGRFLCDGFRKEGRFHAGDTFTTPEFDVRVLAAEPEGVRKLLFTFRKPLTDPSYRFYLGSAACALAPLTFERNASRPPATLPVHVTKQALEAAGARLRVGDIAAADVLLSCARRSDDGLQPVAAALAVPVAEFVGTALGGPPISAASTAEQWGEFADWWGEWVSDQTLRDTWLLRERFAPLMVQRLDLPDARHWAGLVVHADLYLTGRPFPGPR